MAAARSLVGVRFRLHGRDPAYGLDCVGVIVAAHERAGVKLDAPTGYPLRGWSIAQACGWLDASGLVRDDGPARPGDVVLTRPGAGQLHLMIVGDGSAVHAHAGLRCVVAIPWQQADDDRIWRQAVPPGDRQQENDPWRR